MIKRKYFNFIILALLFAFCTLIYTACENSIMTKWWPEEKKDNIYEVKFDIYPSAADAPETQSVPHGGKVTQPPAPQPLSDGSTFGGWYTAEGFTNQYIWNFLYSTVTASMTLYAYWQPKTSEQGTDPDKNEGSGDNFGLVIFNTDGGTPQPKALKVVWGSTVGRLRPISRGSDGFIGWYDEDDIPWDVETRTVEKADDVDGDGFITLTLKWEPYTPSAPIYIVSFIAYPASSVPNPPENAVFIPDQYIAQGSKVVQPAQPPVLPPPDNRGFAGWYTEDTFVHRWNFDIPVIENETLYAKWVDTYRTVIFDAKGGRRPDSYTELHHQFTVTLTDDPDHNGGTISGGLVQDPGPIVKDGYSFAGWFTDENYDYRWDFANRKVTISDNNPLILYAKWERNKYFVNFDISPSTSNNPVFKKQTVLHGDRAEQPPLYDTAYNPPVIQPNPGDGRVFEGWYAEEAHINKWNFNNPVTSTMTLYAKYVPQTRTVHFQVNGGTTTGGFDFLPNRTISLNGNPPQGRIIDPGTLVRPGYSFSGWYIDPACTISWSFASDRITVPDEITGMDPMYLYAKWTGNPYTVSFNENGGTPKPPSQTVQHGDKAFSPIVTRSNYSFAGWCVGSESGALYDFNTPVTSNLTLVAKWEAATFTVTFNLRESEDDLLNKIPSNCTTPSVQYVISGGKAIEPFMPPIDPDIPGDEKKYSFYCWSTSTTGNSTSTVIPFDFDSTITGNVTLYARWVEPPPDMIWVPRGSFTMGDSGVSGTPAAYHAYPTRRVTLDGFFIGRYEVTQLSTPDTNKSYTEVMGVNPSQFYKNDVRPVDRVSWYDAVMYCNALTAQTMSATDQVYTITGIVKGSNLAGTGGVRPAVQSIISANVTADFSKRGYRLPTEAEWEYAARGGNNSPGNYIYSGSNDSTLVAWYNETIKSGADAGSTQTVGGKQPNALGIYDMSGNITEWVWDWFGSYKDSYYSSASAGHNPTGPASGTERIRRGGGWSNAVGNVRSVVRNSQAPGDATWVNGFRVVRGPSAIW